MTAEEIRPGVRELDHTADVGIAVRAASREELFQRSAEGMFALVYGDEPGQTRTAKADVRERGLSLEAADLPALLVRWLRELLYAHEAEGVRYRSASFETLTDTRLVARVGETSDPGRPVREIKGVTYHDLEAVRHAREWRARVVFDV